jgi:hypothetical protein
MKTKIGWGATIPQGADTTAHVRVYLETEIETESPLEPQVVAAEKTVYACFARIHALGMNCLEFFQNELDKTRVSIELPQPHIPIPVGPDPFNPQGPYGPPLPLPQNITANIANAGYPVTVASAQTEVPKFDPAAFGEIGAGSGFFK